MNDPKISSNSIFTAVVIYHYTDKKFIVTSRKEQENFALHKGLNDLVRISDDFVHRSPSTLRIASAIP